MHCKGNALFAALSYAVTQSGRGGGTIDKEAAILEASQIIQYAANIKAGFDRLALMGGCVDTDISFENTIISGDYSNPDSPIDESCHMFEQAGAGKTYVLPKASWLNATYSASPEYGDWYFGSERISGVGEFCLDVSCSEFIMYLPFITKNICLEINRKLGVPEYVGDPPQESDDVHAIHSTQFLKGATSLYLGALNGSGVGKPFEGEYIGCIEGGPGGGSDQSGMYFFYTVLKVR